MRILLTANRGPGHIEPLVPFARAFERAGHDVLLAAPNRSRREADRAGVPFHGLPDRDEDEADRIQAGLASLPPDESSATFVREIFGGLNVRTTLPAMLELFALRRPDLVLRETTEISGLLAAQRHGVAHARVAIMAGATETWGVPVAAPAIDRHRLALGLPPDPTAADVQRSPYLTILPEAMEDPDDPGPAHALRFREPAPPPAPPLPAWWGEDRRPLVYGTFGSVTPRLPSFGELFAATVAALAEVPARVLFTVGTEVELNALGPVPANVHVERWVAQSAVMPHAAAMLSHGGAGSTRLALAAGVPSVVVPAFADQPRNAERVAALGAGLAVADPAEIGDALRRVLAEPSFAAAARRVAAEVAALPPVDEAPAALSGRLAPARAA